MDFTPKLRTVRFDTNQVAQHWPTLLKVIQASLPYEVKTTESNGLFQALIHGSMQAWAIVNSENIPQTIAITRLTKDALDSHKALVIYSFYGFVPVSDSALADAFDSIARFGKSAGATQVIAATKEKVLIERATALGFNMSTLITKDI